MAYKGIADGIDTAHSASGFGQQLAGVFQLLYGGLAAPALLALPVRRRWVMPLVVAWGVAVSVTGGLAAVVWGEVSAIVGVFAGCCTAAIAGLVVWACRRHNDARHAQRRPESA